MIPTPKLALLLNAILCFDLTFGAPIKKREVPQEHSHEQFLTSVRASLNRNNPNQISDPVFGLLGNGAAAGGAGKITDLDCLHQATADQAFTNAKAAGDVQGQVDALVYAALERNTGSVGLKSNLCTSLKAVNPEIAAISQHQDPASDGAAATNKAIVLTLAKQIAKVGGNPQDALMSGTFAPGKIGDPTAKGNSCDDANDPTGCIFTQNLLVPDATAAEIDAAVGGSASSSSSSSGAAPAPAPASNSTSSGTSPQNCPAVTVTVTQSSSSSTTSSSPTTSAAAATKPAAAVTKPASGASSSTTGSSAAAVASGPLNFGSCSNPAIEFGGPFDGRKENAFQPENKSDFNHGSADNIKVITDFICQQLNDKCKASASTITACNTAATAAIAKGAVGAAADAFNAGLGITSDFANNPVGGAAAASSPAAGSSSPAASSSSNTGASSAASSSGLNFGSCSNPAIQFGFGLDGRQEEAFAPEDETTFPHGAALNIKVIADFVCQQLDVKCKASAATLAACASGSTTAEALGKVGAAADAFNKALGIQTDFANNPVKVTKA